MIFELLVAAPVLSLPIQCIPPFAGTAKAVMPSSLGFGSKEI
jgi:hypothetical protein